MSRQIGVFLFAMIAVIVGLDVAVFRHDAWPRLMANVGVVLLWGALYLHYFRSN